MPRNEDAEGAQFAGLGHQDLNRAQDNINVLFSIHGIPADLYKAPPGYNEDSQLVPYGPDAKLIDRFDCRLLLDPEDIKGWTQIEGVFEEARDKYSSEDEALNHLRYRGLNGPEESLTDGAGEEDEHSSYEGNQYGSVPFSYDENKEVDSMGASNNLFPPPAPLVPSILKQQCDKLSASVVAWGPATRRQMAIISLAARYTVNFGGDQGKIEELHEEMKMYGELGFLSQKHSQHGIFRLMLKRWKKKLLDKELKVKDRNNNEVKNESNPLQMILDYEDDEVEPSEPKELGDSGTLLATDAAVKGLIRRYCISYGVSEVQKMYDSLGSESLVDSDQISNLLSLVKEEVKDMEELQSNVQHEAKFDQTPMDESSANPQNDTKKLPPSSEGAAEEDMQKILGDKDQPSLCDEKLQALRRAKAQSLLRKRQLEVIQKTKRRRESFLQQSERDRKLKMAAIGQHKQMFLGSDSD